MPFSPKSALAILFCGLLWATAAQAQRAKPQGFPDAPGKEVLVGKCFQCHAPTMWQDHRQDRTGWEGVLYRMVGRGRPVDGRRNKDHGRVPRRGIRAAGGGIEIRARAREGL